MQNPEKRQVEKKEEARRSVRVVKRIKSRQENASDLDLASQRSTKSDNVQHDPTPLNSTSSLVRAEERIWAKKFPTKLSWVVVGDGGC